MIVKYFVDYYYTYWSFSKYGGELLRSGKKNANCTVVAMAAGSSRNTLTSSAITVSSTGSPMCVIAEISSSGLSKNISPKRIIKKNEDKLLIHFLFY